MRLSCGHLASDGTAARRIDGAPVRAHTGSMLPVVEQLLIIQDRDKKIRALRQELKFAPQQRK